MGEACYIDYTEATKSGDSYTFDYDVEAAVRAAKFVVVREREGYYRSSVAVIDNGDSMAVYFFDQDWARMVTNIRENTITDTVLES